MSQDRPDSINDSMAAAEWDALAFALKKISLNIDGDDAASKKLRAQLGMVKLLMCEEIKEWNGNNTIDLSYLIASYKTIQMIEKEFERRGVKKSEFLLFLKILFYKFKKQKILVVKPLEKRGEFKKMKEVVEHGYGII